MRSVRAHLQGKLIFSCYDLKRGSINRMLVPIKVAKHNSKGQEIRIIMKNWRYQLRGQKGSLRKIIIEKPCPIADIMHQVDEQFIKKNGDTSDRNRQSWATFSHVEPKKKIMEKLVAAQMVFNGARKSWVSNWAEAFQDYDVAVEEKLEKLQNDGGSNRQIRFYQDLQKLNLFDVELKTGIASQATCQMLHDEVANFSRGFSVWL